MRLAVLFCTLLWPVACSTSGETSTGPSPELEEFAAQAIIDEQLEQAAVGYNSPEGAIVALVVSTKSSDGSVSPLRVWRYSQGQLLEESGEALERALGSDRSDWPSFTFVFTFEAATSRRATIDVHTHYDMGLAPTSRGGNAQIWELEKQSGEWAVTKKEPYGFWD